MIKKSVLILLVFLILPFITASTSLTPVKLDSCSNIIQTISNASFCNMTLYYPNQSKVLNNVQMSKIGDIYNYSFCSNSVQGDYVFITQCNPNGVLGDPIPSDYIVNGYGSNVSTSQIIGYGIILIIALLISAITFYYAAKIPFQNNRDEEDKIISINDFKYVKILLYVFGYLEILFIVSIAKNMALGFLLSDGIYDFFNIIYNFMLIALIPMLPLIVFFTIVIWLSDKKVMENIQRGIE